MPTEAPGRNLFIQLGNSAHRHALHGPQTVFAHSGLRLGWRPGGARAPGGITGPMSKTIAKESPERRVMQGWRSHHRHFPTMINTMRAPLLFSPEPAFGEGLGSALQGYTRAAAVPFSAGDAPGDFPGQNERPDV